MLVPIFTLNLSHRFLPHRVSVGCYDGKHPCLTAGTTADKVFIHNPHNRGSFLGGRISTSVQSSDISLLNINQSVTSLVAGNLVPGCTNDVLVVGTQTSVLAYDILNNADLFYKEIPDGVSSVIIGKPGNIENSVALIGGNCTIQGFDHKGNDVFWTVTGDNVSALSMCDFTEDGCMELLVGSEDFEIRIFKDDEIIAEITETEAVTSLCFMEGSKFGYALANGTVGVYDRLSRYWRIKSKNHAMSIHSYDLDLDGVPELITGWSNGKVDARNDRSGEVIFKDNFSNAVAGIVEADYRLDGKNELICCAVNGEVRGYLPISSEKRHSLMDIGMEQDTIRELIQRKQNLLLELNNYESARTGSFLNQSGSKGTIEPVSLGMIPSETQLQTGLAINMGSADKPPHVEIALMTTNETVIRAVVIFAEGIFEGESHVIHPKESQLSNTINVPISPPKDVPVDLHIKVFIGYNASVQYHVFELTRQLPRFSMYAVCSEPIPDPQGIVSFHINDRVQRVVLWINQNFLLLNYLELEESGILDIAFLSLRTSKPIKFRMETTGEVTLRTDDIELAGDVIQALASFLNLDELSVTCDFPEEMKQLAATVQKVEEYNATRQTMIADMADNSGYIRSLVIRAEDSRLMGDLKSMKRWYMELFDLNRDLINGYKIRSNNHQELLKCLKIVNQTIQRAGQLRVGKAKTQLINGCRNALKNNTPNALYKIIKTGAS